MTKAEIVQELYEATGIDKKDVLTSVEAFLATIKRALIDGKNVYIRGFGSFIVKKRAKKIARNISQNTAMVIPEHFIPGFKPAKVFVNKVKNSNKLAKK